jgi:hypothetical protein
MSLAVLANDMASRGRGEDSMLVHMTPHEVAGLQALAMKHGGSLTINPETGLPEAGFLKSLLPMLAGIALGPAGFGLMSAGMAGLTVGGLTTLATGSLSRGLMAGMGAYGGAGLSEALAGAGEGALSSQISGEIARDKAAEIASGQLGEEEVGKMVSQRLADTSGLSKAGAGLSALTESPATAMNFAKQNVMPLAAAATPIMADAMIPTTTKMPTNTNPAYIRQYVAGDRPQAPRALAPVLASEWGSRSFQDAYAKPMATGGIVALAGGGTPPEMLTDEQLFQKTGSWEAAAAARDAQNNALNQYNWAQQAAAATPVDYNKVAADYVKAAAVPTETTQQFISGAEQAGLGLTQPLASALQNSGLSAAAQYALTHADIGPAQNAAETYGGLAGLSNNINYIAGGLQSQIGSGALTAAQARENALTEMNKYGLNEADILRATGKTVAELFPDAVKKKTPPPIICGPGFVLNAEGTACVPVKAVVDDTGTKTDTVVTQEHTCPSGYHWDPAANACVLNTNATQSTTEVVTTPTTLLTAPATTLPVGVSGTTGPSIEGGGATVNPNGTITTSPRIPYIPVGGFTGMDQVRDAYTKGGGSLGYTPYVPKTAAEHDQMFNKQTGDSLAAYNYLIGKGAYPTKSGASEIMKPYEEAVLGYPTDLTKKKYINVNGKMVLNPQYVAPKGTTSGTAGTGTTSGLTAAKTIYVVNNRGESETATLSADGNYYTSGGDAYDVTGKQVQAKAAGGIAGYAVGGGLGSLGSYSDGGRLLKGPGDGVSDSIPATIGAKQQPARLADGEFVVPARIVSELGNGSTDAGAKKLYAMMDRVQRARGKTTGKNKVAANSRADKYLPA